VLTNFWVQHALWGVDPFGYRLVTLACHIASALLLWRVLHRLQVPGAWLGAALWGLHPVQVESVAWICELKNTQSAVFFLLAIGFWIRWLDSQRGTEGGAVGTRVTNGPAGSGRVPAHRSTVYAFALLAALGAILSKPSTVMLPVALGLVGWWVRGRLRWRDIFPLAPFFVLSAIAAGWTIWEQRIHSGAIGPEWSQSLPERIAIAGRVIWFYLGKLAWPEPLMFIYPRWEIHATQLMAYIGAIAAGAGLFWLWRGRNDRRRPGFFAAAYFVALLFPVLGFFSVYFFRYAFVGDHFQYLASMGPMAFVGAAIATVVKPQRQRHDATSSDSVNAPYVRTVAREATRPIPPITGVVSGALLLALGLLTARQARVYLNSESLWRDTLAHNPGAVMAWLNLADTLTRAGRYDEAMATFKRALEIRPTDPDGWNDLGNVLVLVGRSEEALRHFERALTLKPDFADAHSNYGNALRSLGRSEEAIAHYQRALEIKPNHPGALNNLGAELAQTGRAGEALPLFQRALRLTPDDAALHDNLAGALRELRRFDEALSHHREALRLQPNFAEGHANLGRTLATLGRVAEAIPEFEKALKLKPHLVSARSAYANTLAALGRPADALAQFERAVELAPASAEAHHNLGAALAQLGRTDEAISHFEKALQLAPSFGPAHANLGTALLALQRWPQAIPHLEAAAKSQPASATIRGQLAAALANDGQLAAAMPHFEAALQLNPQSAELHDNFGQVLSALGRKREAFEHLEEAARLRRSGSR
jgi:tetratricopeptide (TPR) repeat protein